MTPMGYEHHPEHLGALLLDSEPVASLCGAPAAAEPFPAEPNP